MKTRYDKYLFFFQTAYNKKDAVYTYLRQVMALPFLPPEHIPDTFNRLQEKATNQDNQAIQDVLHYVYRTWINNNIFNIEYWSVFMTSIRTNNDVEGWHNRINYRVAARGPVPFYSILTELFSEVQIYHSSWRWSPKVNCRDTKDVTHARYRVNCLPFGTSTATTPSRHPGYWKSVPAFMDHHRSNFVDNEHCVCVTMNFLCNVCVVFVGQNSSCVTCIYYVYFI